jgi:NADH-quinone oxidoreductase subunit M
VQKDLKFVIGYSSVSHMGFILLGLAAGTQWALRGAVLQMISHGIIAGLLFGIAGRVIYERTHSRDLDTLREFDLWHSLPGAAIGFTLATAASMGIPGFSGFVAEISVILGVWPVYPWAVLWVVLEIVITGAFSLRALQKAFFAAKPAGHGNGKAVAFLPPLTWAEIAAMTILIGATLAIGLYPKPWVFLIDDGLRSPLFQSILSKP